MSAWAQTVRQLQESSEATTAPVHLKPFSKEPWSLKGAAIVVGALLGGSLKFSLQSIPRAPDMEP